MEYLLAAKVADDHWNHPEKLKQKFLSEFEQSKNSDKNKKKYIRQVLHDRIVWLIIEEGNVNQNNIELQPLDSR